MKKKNEYEITDTNYKQYKELLSILYGYMSSNPFTQISLIDLASAAGFSSLIVIASETFVEQYGNNSDDICAKLVMDIPLFLISSMAFFIVNEYKKYKKEIRNDIKLFKKENPDINVEVRKADLYNKINEYERLKEEILFHENLKEQETLFLGNKSFNKSDNYESQKHKVYRKTM